LGVSCDFCTITDVDLSNRDHPFDLKPGRVKRGPLEYATLSTRIAEPFAGGSADGARRARLASPAASPQEMRASGP
jgi:hypothetical protein